MEVPRHVRCLQSKQMKVRALLGLALVVGGVLLKIMWTGVGSLKDVSSGIEARIQPVSSRVALTEADNTEPPPTRRPLASALRTSDEELAGGEMITISGRMIVLDDEGVRHPHEDGSFTPIIFAEVGAERWRPGEVPKGGYLGSSVAVSGGQFQLTIEPRKEFKVWDLLLGGERAVAIKPYYSSPPETRNLTVVGKWLASPKLVVRDAKTLESLTPVDIVHSGWRKWTVYGNSFDEHPGLFREVDLIYQGEPAPISLDSQLFLSTGLFDLGRFASRVVWVRSPGYAWRRATLRFSEDTEIVVDLYPSAALVVSVVAPPEVFTLAKRGTVELVMRLRTDRDPEARSVAFFENLLGEDNPENILPQDRPYFVAILERLRENEQLEGVVLTEMYLTRGEFVVTGLPAKKTTVSIEMGFDDENRQVLAWASLELVAGEEAHIQLVVDQLPPQGVPRDVGGTFRLPSAWRAKGLQLELVAGDSAGSIVNPRTAIPVSHMKSLPSSEEGLYRWSAGKLVPGRYMALVSSLQFSQEVTVPPEGVDDLHIEVGAPAIVTINAVDRDTGRVVPIETLHWTSSQSAGAESETFGIANQEPDSEAYSLVAPAGRIELFCWSGASYYFYHEPHDVLPGKGEITLRLVRSCGVKLTASGEASSPKGLALGRYVHVKRSGSEEDESSAQFFEGEDGTLLVQLPSPGRHTITFEAIEGFSPLEEFTVDLLDGEFAERTIALKRSH